MGKMTVDISVLVHLSGLINLCAVLGESTPKKAHVSSILGKLGNFVGEEVGVVDGQSHHALFQHQAYELTQFHNKIDQPA